MSTFQALLQRQPVSRVLFTSFAVVSSMTLAACSGAGAPSTGGTAPTSPATQQSDAAQAGAPSTGASAAGEEGVELPGGGRTVFPDRRIVALYGTPGTPGLGVLGEYTPEQAVAEAKKMAEQYQPYSTEPVQPGFEIITTVASASPGANGTYSIAHADEKLAPLIDAATKNDVHVILDLQPGRATFLSQAKLYEDFLKKPNVHLALDPEWRLTEPGMRHIDTVGHVTAAEINETSDWLATLVRDNKLPQKMLVVHQFEDQMIRDKASLNVSHPEVAFTLHMDGHGDQQLKSDTYDRVIGDLPKGGWPAWKNFIDEDTPTWTPEQTMKLNPTPWFVSYQ